MGEFWIDIDKIDQSSSIKLLCSQTTRDFSSAISKTEIVDSQTLISLGHEAEWDLIRDAGVNITKAEYQYETRLLPETWGTFTNSPG